MTTEYWLQKKTIGGWSHVTWYNELEQAQINYDRLRQQTGYSYRLVSVNVIQEHMLEEVVKVEAPEIEQSAKANVWGGQTENNWTPTKALAKSNVSSGWNDLPADSQRSEHGLTGSVWVIHHKDKVKKRIKANELDEYKALGYEIGGPRMQFRI